MTATTDRSPFEDIAQNVRKRLDEQLEQNIAFSREQFDKIYVRLAENIDEWSSYAKANTDALSASSGTVAKGLQDLGKEADAYAHTLFELSQAAGKRLLAAGTLGEVLEVQQTVARSGFDVFVAESTKIRDLSLKIAEEAAAPLTARVGAWSDAFTKPRRPA